MAELKLEPFTARIRCRRLADEPEVPWGWLLAECVETLAERCVEAGPCVIGHIKGVALFDGGRYLRISAVDANRAADVDGEVPADCREFILTLNVLVYGHSREIIRQLTDEVIGVVGSRVDGQITIEVEPVEQARER
ncbi:MAG: hypothetical protein ACUVX1_05405 [Chloroflexota bacterium]